jgi:hypothetical protein
MPGGIAGGIAHFTQSYRDRARRRSEALASPPEDARA